MKRLQLKYIVYTEAYLNAAILVSLFALVKHCVSQSFRSKVRSCDRANDLIVAVHDGEKPHSYASKKLVGSLHSTVQKKANEVQQLAINPKKKKSKSYHNRGGLLDGQWRRVGVRSQIDETFSFFVTQTQILGQRRLIHLFNLIPFHERIEFLTANLQVVTAKGSPAFIASILRIPKGALLQQNTKGTAANRAIQNSIVLCVHHWEIRVLTSGQNIMNDTDLVDWFDKDDIGAHYIAGHETIRNR